MSKSHGVRGIGPLPVLLRTEGPRKNSNLSFSFSNKHFTFYFTCSISFVSLLLIINSWVVHNGGTKRQIDFEISLNFINGSNGNKLFCPSSSSSLFVFICVFPSESKFQLDYV